MDVKLWGLKVKERAYDEAEENVSKQERGSERLEKTA